MKKIINILLSFFMALVIFVGSLSFVGAIVTSDPFIKSTVVISGYFNNAEKEIAESLKSVAIPSGLPENFFDDKIETEFIKETVNNSISAALRGKEYVMPSEKIEALVLEDITLYAKQNGVELNQEATEMLKETARLSADYYKNYTYNIFDRALKHIKGISLKLSIAFLAFAVVGVLMYFLLKNKKELSYALSSGGAMLIIPVLFAIIKGAFNLAIGSEALLSFMNNLIGSMIAIIIGIGGFAIFLSIKNTKKINKK